MENREIVGTHQRNSKYLLQEEPFLKILFLYIEREK